MGVEDRSNRPIDMKMGLLGRFWKEKTARRIDWKSNDTSSNADNSCGFHPVGLRIRDIC
jgi:hypothetical protein